MLKSLEKSHRTPWDCIRIDRAKQQSRCTHMAQLILENQNSREYYRFIDGKLFEYDCTKYKGEQVRLEDDEYDAWKEHYDKAVRDAR